MLHDFEICQPGTGARLKEVEAELAQCLDCCKRVGKLEAERDAAKAQNKVLRDASQRLSVLAVKWVDAGHHDWPEIKNLLKIVDG